MHPERADRGNEKPGAVRQRVANEIWTNYHDDICARIKFADPTPDKQRTNEDEAVSDAAKQAEQAQRYTIQQGGLKRAITATRRRRLRARA